MIFIGLLIHFFHTHEGRIFFTQNQKRQKKKKTKNVALSIFGQQRLSCTSFFFLRKKQVDTVKMVLSKQKWDPQLLFLFGTAQKPKAKALFTKLKQRASDLLDSRKVTEKSLFYCVVSEGWLLFTEV